jgi:hypothetical protein
MSSLEGGFSPCSAPAGPALCSARAGKRASRTGRARAAPPAPEGLGCPGRDQGGEKRGAPALGCPPEATPTRGPLAAAVPPYHHPGAARRPSRRGTRCQVAPAASTSRSAIVSLSLCFLSLAFLDPCSLPSLSLPVLLSLSLSVAVSPSGHTTGGRLTPVDGSEVPLPTAPFSPSWSGPNPQHSGTEATRQNSLKALPFS